MVSFQTKLLPHSCSLTAQGEENKKKKPSCGLKKRQVEHLAVVIICLNSFPLQSIGLNFLLFMGGSTISSEQILSATPSSLYSSYAPVWVFSMHCNPSRGVCSSTSSPQALVTECPFGQEWGPIKTAMWVSAPVWSSLC